MKKPSRRTFIKGSIGVIGATMSKPSWALPETFHSYDSIVIGGGYSGIVAARDLFDAKLKILVLEAGGSAEISKETNYNAQWFHPSQKYVVSEFSRYGLELTTRNNCNIALRTGLHKLNGEIEGKLIRSRNVDVLDFISEKNFNEEQKVEITKYVACLANIYGRKVRAQDIVKLNSLVDEDVDDLASVVGCYKLDNENKSLYYKIVANLAGNIKYNSTVTLVEPLEDMYVVCEGQTRYITKSVIFATPHAVAKSILTGKHDISGRPEVPIVFANTDLAEGWRGFIDGAIESGKKASIYTKSFLI